MVSAERPDWDNRPATIEALSVALDDLLPHVERAVSHARARQDVRAAEGRRLSRRHVDALGELERRLTSLSDAITDILAADGSSTPPAGEPEPAVEPELRYRLPPDAL
jgi:hypothetical protein